VNDKFTFFRSYYEAAKRLPEDTRLKYYEAIFARALDGVEYSGDDNVARAMYMLAVHAIKLNNGAERGVC
jgi:hypothetical protein